MSRPPNHSPSPRAVWPAFVSISLLLTPDFTSFRSLMSRMVASTKAAKKSGGPPIDSMTALQVAGTASFSTEELIAKPQANGPRAARWRAKAPALCRRMSMKE